MPENLTATIAARARALIHAGKSARDALELAQADLPEQDEEARGAAEIADPPALERPDRPMWRSASPPAEDVAELTGWKTEYGASGWLQARFSLYLGCGAARVKAPAEEAARKRADLVLAPVAEQFRKGESFAALVSLRQRRAELAQDLVKRAQAVTAAEAARAEALTLGVSAAEEAEGILQDARRREQSARGWLADLDTRLQAAEQQTAAALLELLSKAAEAELLESRQRRETAALALVGAAEKQLVLLEAESSLERLLSPAQVKRDHGVL
jgi:hypothetical protein